MTRTSSPENAAQSRFSGLWEGDAAAPDPGAIIAEASNAGRDKAFRRERKRRARAMPRIQHETAAELGRLFRRADRELRAELRAGDSDFTAWLAPQQRRRITELLDALGTEAGQRLVSGQDRSWDAGIASVDAPINAALELGAAHGASGAAIGDHLVQPDLRQLGAMRTFLTGKMKQVTAQTINRVNTQIGLVALGVHSAGDGVSAISKVLGSTRKRAITILRTELGRAYATAAQERQAQAVAVLPGLRKQWRRSGKLHSRLTHDAADGQIREVDKPFDVGGVELMYPRDPAAPAGETINCGCESLSYMESWETAGTLLDARARAFTEREIAARPMRAELGSAPAAPAAAPPAADDEPVTVRAPVPRVGQLPPDPERERRTARSQVARVRTLLARGDIDQARDMVHTITHGSAFDRGNKHGWPVGISPGGLLDGLAEQAREGVAAEIREALARPLVVVDGMRATKLARRHKEVTIRQYRALQRALDEGELLLEMPTRRDAGRATKRAVLLAHLPGASDGLPEGAIWKYAMTVEPGARGRLRLSSIYRSSVRSRNRRARSSDVITLQRPVGDG